MTEAETQQAMDDLDRAGRLMQAISRASEHERAKQFRFISAFFLNHDVNQPRIKGFQSHEEGMKFFKEQGVELGWFQILYLGDPNVIQMC